MNPIIIIPSVIIIVLITMAIMRLRDLAVNNNRFKVFMLRTSTIYIVEERFLSKFKVGSFWETLSNTGDHICTVTGKHLPLTDNEKEVIRKTGHLVFTKEGSDNHETSYEDLTKKLGIRNLS